VWPVADKKDTSIVENGLIIGLIVLALVVVFAVGLVRWHKGAQGAAVHLPDTLSGGFAALDDQSAYAGYSPSAAASGQSAPTSAQIIGQVQKLQTTAAQGLANLPDAASERIYGTVSGQGLTGLIEAAAFRSGGGPLTPGNLGYASGTVTKFGDVYCSAEASQSGTDTTCQRAEENLTVQVYSPSLAGAQLAPYADEVYKDLTHSTW
jgi:hypothetical protein